jgi:hypothetical protein
MAPLVSTIEIACTFAVATDPRRFAEWQHDVVTDQRRQACDDPTNHPYRSTPWLGCARHRRPHP